MADNGSQVDARALSGLAQQWLYRYELAKQRHEAARAWLENPQTSSSAPSSQIDAKQLELIKAELEINKLIELATRSTQRSHPPIEPVTFLDWNERAASEYLNAFEAAGRPPRILDRTDTIGSRVYSNVDHNTSWDKNTVMGWINQKIDDVRYWWNNEAAIDAKHYAHVTCEQGLEAVVSGLARGAIRIKIPGRDGSGKHLEDKYYDRAGETIADSEKKCDVLIGKDPTKAPFPDPAKELLRLNSLDELTPEFARQVLAQLGEDATDSRIAEVLALIRTAASGSDDLAHVSTFTVRGADGEVLGTGSTRAYQSDAAISTVTEVKGLDGGAPVIEVSGRLADGVEYRQMLQAAADGTYSIAGNTELIVGGDAGASIDIAGLHDELGRRLGEFGVRTDTARIVLVTPEAQPDSATDVATSDDGREPIRVAQADQADGSRPDVLPMEASEATGQPEDTAQDNSTTPAEVPPQAIAFQAGWTLYQSIRGGDGLGIATAGVNAVNIANWYNDGKLLPDDAAQAFGTTGSGLGLASAGVGLFNAIDSGDPLGIAYSTASLAQQATQLWAGSVNSSIGMIEAAGDMAIGLYSEAAALSAAASVLGEVVPILGAVLALSQGNVIGAIGSILMMIPATFVIGLVITILSSLFGGDDEPEYDWIPAAGKASYTRGEDSAIGIEASGTNTHKSIESTPVGPGTEGANVVAGKLAAALSSLLLEVKASQRDEDGPSALALIPERLPGLHFLGHNAFVIEFTDPLTGETRQVGANIVDVERLLVEVAHHTEALAPAWEAEQVEAKLAAGDPNAADTEAQYAHRLNPEASTELAERGDRQSLPALLVDLAGDGITTMKLPEETGRTLADLLDGPVRFDVDSDGFLEAVEWPALGEALLALDRDGDGRIGSVRELLASPNLPEPMRGNEMLAWLDANHDGLLDHRDPGFAALKLWLDVNADAQSDPGEVLSLGQIGANALALGPAGESDATIRLESGASLTVEEVALEAETDGVRMAVLPGGVQVEAENGLDGQGTDARLLYVSGVADLSDPETARIWGVDPALATSRGLGTSDADGLDPSSDGGHRASREARRIVLGGAEQGLLFAGAAGAIAALGLGAPGTAAAEELGGRIEFVLPDGTLAPLAAPIVITEAASRPREAASVPLPPAHPPIVAQASDVVSLPLLSATTDPEPLPARSVGASPPIVVTAEAITPVSAPASALGELAPVAEPPAGGVDPFAQMVPTIVSQLTRLEDDAIVIDGAELLERAGLDGVPASVISWAGEAQHGQVFLGADGLVRFIPEANFHGTASFTYMLGGLLGRAEVLLGGVNDAPVPIGDLVAGEEDRELLFTAGALAANDWDPDIATDGDSLRVTAVSSPEHGSVELLPDGTVRFTPEADFWGEARFAYTVEDDNGASATGTAFVQLASVNDAPLATGELIEAGVEDTALLVDPLLLVANDTDIDTPTDGDVLTVSAVFDAEHGTVSLLADGSVQFVPDANFHGLAAFGYTVSDGRGGLAHAQALVRVAGVNDAPIGVDEVVAGAEDSPLVIVPAALLANEVDPDIVTDGQLLKVAAVGEAEHGAVGLAPDGTVVFVPETDYWGEAAFSYTVSDGAGGFTSARATVTLSPVEDPPIAGADGFAGVEDATLLLDPALLIINDHDPDGDAVHFAGVAGATHGAVSLQEDGQVRFTPAPDFFGRASFGYLVADTKGNVSQGTAFVQLENVNDAPRVEAIEFGRALYAYDENSGYDSEGNYSSSIQPIYDHAKALELYAAGEARNSSGAPIVATYYQNGTLKPIGFDMSDAASYDEWGGSSYDDPLLAQGRVVAYDPDGDTLSFSLAAHPVHGSAAVGVGWTLPDESNAWRYQSTYGDGYHGADPFVVRVTDPSGESSTMTVHTSHYGTIAGGGGDGGCCPVMIDLDADGVELVDVDDSRLLRDLDGDGWMERLGWAAEDDALLAYDADDDGFITRADEISFVAYKPGARTDLEGLAAFDTDGDGKLTAADAEWGRFHLWQDRGADGRSDLGELTPLAETDIIAISLASDGQREARGANVLFGRSSYERSDGSTGEVGDVMFATRETGIPAGPAPPPVPNAAAEALEAHFARLALQFVQDMAAFDPKAPAELDVPPSAPPPEATLAENPLQRHEQAGTG